jgi:hypothetical protein
MPEKTRALMRGENFYPKRSPHRSFGGVDVRIDKWVYGGAGLARTDGRVTLTPFVLPANVRA